MHGVVRPIDKLGRIVIPKEYRKILNISNKDKLEIIIKDDSLEIKKYDLDNKFIKIYNLYYKTLSSIYPNSLLFSDFNKIYYKDSILNYNNIGVQFNGISDILYLRDKFVIENQIFDNYYVIPIKDKKNLFGVIVINVEKENNDIIDFINKLVNN